MPFVPLVPASPLAPGSPLSPLSPLGILMLPLPSRLVLFTVLILVPLTNKSCLVFIFSVITLFYTGLVDVVDRVSSTVIEGPSP
nr:MAG TPA: hypothetical protein [Caudoviricetes sp.]